MDRKFSAYLFIMIFLLITVGLGIPSFRNLSRFYINDEVIDNDWTEALGSKFETNINSTFFRKFSFVNLNGAMRNLFGQREMNGVIKLDNGYLTAPLDKCPDDVLRNFANRTASFSRYLKNRGTSLVFVAPPYTTGKYEPGLPAGFEDFSNENLDHLLMFLQEAGVDTIDIREQMWNDRIDHYSMMYKTDHHWTTEAGFYAYGILEKYIIEKTGCQVDPRVSDISNYTVSKYEKWHLGTRGRRTGIYFAGVDDFVLIAPDFETGIQNDQGEIGTVYDFFIKTEPLQHRDYLSQYTYENVMGDGAYIGHYRNLHSRNEVKILNIADSFAKVVTPYMIMGFSEVNTTYDNFVVSITPELIESYDPDIVIMMYYPAYINSSSGSFDFNGF